MGLFSFVLAGCGFILIGAWESISSSNAKPDSDPSSPLSRVKIDPISRPKSDRVRSLVCFISGSVFSLLAVLNSLVSIFDALNSKDRVGSALQLQVLATALLFLLYSVLGILVNRKKSFLLPVEILDLILLFAFVEEFLLFYMQRKDPSGIENRYFDLSLVPISICVVSTVLELRSKRSIYPKLARGVGLILQGTWFIQMGFSFYTGLMVHGCALHEKSKGNYTVKCKGHPEYHRGRAIATLQFNLHLALVMVLVVGFYSVLARKNGVSRDSSQYKPLGTENGQMESSGNFTLDSDDDLDDGIKEEESFVKEKGAIVEMVANGHGSHD